MTERACALGLLAVVAVAPARLDAQERHAIGGEHVAIFNLAGEIEVQGTAGGQVTIEVTRGGRDGSELAIEAGEVDGRQTFRVVYPETRIVYAERGWSGNTTLRVRRDGTWGGRASIPFLGGARSVRISNRGSGLDAHADLRIGVPRGQRLDIHLAVGRITAENVDGHVRLDTHSGGVTARAMAGDLTIDTGSGRARVSGMRGNLLVDTGSGGVEVEDVISDRFLIDTGSGSVQASNVVADRLTIDTGSGRIELREATARDILLDTGSGSVRADIAGDIERLVIDTGSGSVTLRVPAQLDAMLVIDTGSGGIDVDLPAEITRQTRNELRAVLGEGRGRIRIDTGSGRVRVGPLEESAR